MAGTVSVELYREFLTAAGAQTAGLGEVRFALEEVIGQLGAVVQQQSSAPGVKTTSAEKGSDSTLMTVLKSGLGVGGLIGGLVGLFSGGEQEAPAPLVKYALPASVRFDAAESDGRITTAEYNQTGQVRTASSQITVNVQAMDARSFLDRSGDIAMAVRDAMLNLNSINDVVNDL